VEDDVEDPQRILHARDLGELPLGIAAAGVVAAAAGAAPTAALSNRPVTAAETRFLTTISLILSPNGVTI
jgi:hypothetical protein